MKTKIVGIFVLTLLITTTIPISGKIMTNIKNINEMKISKNGGWYKTYGGDGIDSFKGLQLTSDGNYILSGETEIYGSRDAWIIKVDTNGNVIWETTYGTTNGWDGLWPIIETSDGGYLAGGWFYNLTQDSKDALLIKVNENGDIIWAHTYGGAEEDEFYSIQETVDGFIVTGKSASYSSSMFDGYIVKIDFDGNVIWSKTYEKKVSSGEFDFITRANEGDGYIISGGYWNPLSLPTQGRLLKIDQDGNVLWDKSYGKLLSCDYIPAVTNTPDDNYIIAGFVGAGPLGLGLLGSDGWLLKVDNDGDILWSKQYGKPLFKDYLICVQPTSDDGFILTGHTLGIGNFGEPSFAAWSKMWLVKTDENGDKVWEKKMPGDGHCRTVREINDGFILCGYQGDGHASKSEHAVLIKTDIYGEI